MEIPEINSLVDERVKKAVEEFRERAVSELKKLGHGEMNLFENTAGELGDPTSGRVFLKAAEIVKALPTEPEGK